MTCDLQEKLKAFSAHGKNDISFIDCGGVTGKRFLTMPYRAASMRTPYARITHGSWHTSRNISSKFLQDDPHRIQKNYVLSSISQWVSDEKLWQDLGSVDSFLGISEHGVMEAPVEIDQVFLTMLSRAGISTETFVSAMQKSIIDNFGEKREEIKPLDGSLIGSIGFANVDPKLHFKKIKGINSTKVLTLDPAFKDVMPFNGRIYKGQTMCFDIKLAEGIEYKSSAAPTVVIQNGKFPQIVFETLNGQPINSLMDDPIFGEHVIIKRVVNQGNSVILYITPDRVDISHLASKSHKTADINISETALAKAERVADSAPVYENYESFMSWARNQGFGQPIDPNNRVMEYLEARGDLGYQNSLLWTRFLVLSQEAEFIALDNDIKTRIMRFMIKDHAVSLYLRWIDDGTFLTPKDL